jgi:predicted nucleic-acid-binding protein
MSLKAKEAVEQGACSTIEVLAEVVYVLSGVYHAQRQEIRDWLICLLDEIVMVNKQAIIYALERYGETTLDFIDCVLLGYNHIQGRRIYTFDKALCRMLRSEHM